MIMDSDLALAILVGGESLRMGTAKMDLDLRGKPILEYLLDRLRWAGPTMLVGAPGRAQPRGAGRFDQVVSDPIAGVGPLRGILTAIESAPSDIIVVATIDMPCVDGEQLSWVGQQLIERPEDHGVMIQRVDGSQIRVEPFPSAYRRSAAAIVAEELSQPRRAVRGLLRNPGFCAVDAPRQWDERTWTNLTTPEDVSRFNSC